MSLTHIEREIVAAGEKVRDLAVKGGLELRRSNLLKEVAKIEEELSRFVEAVVEKVKPVPAKKAAATERADDSKAK